MIFLKQAYVDSMKSQKVLNYKNFFCLVKTSTVKGCLSYHKSKDKDRVRYVKSNTKTLKWKRNILKKVKTEK